MVAVNIENKLFVKGTLTENHPKHNNPHSNTWRWLRHTVGRLFLSRGRKAHFSGSACLSKIVVLFETSIKMKVKIFLFPQCFFFIFYFPLSYFPKSLSCLEDRCPRTCSRTFHETLESSFIKDQPHSYVRHQGLLMWMNLVPIWICFKLLST